MAKLRRNHTKSSAAAGGGMMVKVGIFAAILGVLFFVFNQFSGSGGSIEEAMEKAEDILSNNNSGNENPGGDNNTERADLPKVSSVFFPTSTTGEIIEHDHYALSYSEEHDQAEWVAYELTKESLIIPNVDRTGNFRPDPKVRKASASHRDYSNSGYDRGHMAPAVDMAFSKTAISTSPIPPPFSLSSLTSLAR